MSVRRSLLWLALLPVVAGPSSATPVSWAEQRLVAAVHDVEPTLQRWGYPALVGVVAVNYLGVPLPADTMVVAATLAADRGDLRLPVVVVLAIASMILGSQIGFCLGRWGGRALLRRLPLASERLARIESQHARWGHWLVLAAPFIDGVRQLAALTAGMLGMKWWLFTTTNLLAAILWAATWIGATLLVEEHVGAILPFLRTAKPWLFLAALLALVAAALYLRRGGEPPHAASR